MEIKQKYVGIANIKGGPHNPEIKGRVYIEDLPYGAWIYVDIYGLPPYKSGNKEKAPIGPFGFHMHEFGNCSLGRSDDSFKEAGGHWNPTNQPHGNHAGDFPVLLSNDGICIMNFFTNKFRVKDVIGKSIVIHENPDDYRTQPAGDSGKRIACGVIRPYAYYLR